MFNLVILFLSFLNQSAYGEENPSNILQLQGKWVVDVPASVNRCFRIEMNDCKGRDKKVVLKKWQEDIERKGTITFEFNENTVKAAFGKRVDESTFTVTQKGFGFTVINIEGEPGTTNNLVFINEEPNVICLGEINKRSDSICLRKTP